MNLSLGSGAVSLSDGSGQLKHHQRGRERIGGGHTGVQLQWICVLGKSGGQLFARGSLQLSGTNDVLTAGDETLSGISISPTATAVHR